MHTPHHHSLALLKIGPLVMRPGVYLVWAVPRSGERKAFLPTAGVSLVFLGLFLFCDLRLSRLLISSIPP